MPCVFEEQPGGQGGWSSEWGEQEEVRKGGDWTELVEVSALQEDLGFSSK